ncbi:apoptosis-associated speck-like protein containing a CARD [Cyclopterus lumpus]|uniref:PYD and CARD domain containing n=1 Tax=Cyclopterus lumpus TaxID=8103 RepID=A0A8C3G1T9_CYCLU|nr:apoptosis-associated speck-like protein containing a CARD [Cyclopterus lumpus]
MAPKSARKAIKDALETLSKKNFDRFCDALLDRRAEPRVRRNALEGESYLVVGNVLVETFTEARAPGVVVELLREINCHQVADTLAEETSGQSSKPGSAVRPSAGATGVNTMAEDNCSGEDFVNKHRAELIERVTDIGAIMDGLLDKEVTSQGIYDEIMATPNKRDKMRLLYSGALHAAGREGKEVFYKLLEENEKYLMKDLKKKK